MTYSNSNPKQKTYRNKKYLAYIRTLPCIICGGIAEPCHVRKSYWGAGVSQKPHDYVAVPGCRTHHNDVENLVNIEKEIIKCLIGYIESRKHLKNQS